MRPIGALTGAPAKHTHRGMRVGMGVDMRMDMRMNMCTCMFVDSTVARYRLSQPLNVPGTRVLHMCLDMRVGMCAGSRARDDRTLKHCYGVPSPNTATQLHRVSGRVLYRALYPALYLVVCPALCPMLYLSAVPTVPSTVTQYRDAVL